MLSETGDKNLEDKKLSSLGRSRRVAFQTPSFGVLADICAETDLIGVLPERIATRAASQGRLEVYSAEPFVEPLQIGLVWHRRHRDAPYHRWFRDLIAEVAAELHDAIAAP